MDFNAGVELDRAGLSRQFQRFIKAIQFIFLNLLRSFLIFFAAALQARTRDWLRAFLDMCFGVVGLRRSVACFFTGFFLGFFSSLVEGFLAAFAGLGDDSFALGDDVFVFVFVRLAALRRACFSFGNCRLNLSDSILVADC